MWLKEVRAVRQSRRRLAGIEPVVAAAYGTPHLGNLSDPLDELIFILLSVQTSERTYIPAFKALKERFPDWRNVADAPVDAIERVIRPAGLSNQKAPRIQSVIRRTIELYGSPTLEPLANMPDRVAEEALDALPGVGKKVARCVLMYSLRRQVFPVDTHIHRIFVRIGLLDQAIGLKRAHDPIQEMVPPALRYSLHVNLIEHGRLTCRTSKPRCTECAIARYCATRRRQLRRQT